MVKLFGIAILIPVLLASVGLAWFVFGEDSDPPQLATAAPTIAADTATPVPTTGVPRTPSATPSAPSVTPGASATVASPSATPTETPTASATPASPGSMSFGIVTGESNATLVVTKVIAGRESSAVAEGGSITGTLYLTPSGVDPSKPTEIRLDLRTLESSDLLISSTLPSLLETDKYPYGQFAVESSSAFPPDYNNGVEFVATVSGTLSLHGVDRQAQWQLKLRQSGSVLTGIADADLKMTDYDIQPPNLGIASARNTVHLQVVFVAHETE